MEQEGREPQEGNFAPRSEIPRFRAKPLERTLPVGGRSWAVPRETEDTLEDEHGLAHGRPLELSEGERGFADDWLKTLLMTSVGLPMGV